MIHIPQHKPLNKENVLALIDESSIFNYYLPNLVVGKTMKSPYRKEENPSFLITVKDGEYYYSDLGNSTYQGDTFHFLMQLFNISFPEALQMINKDFGLGFQGEVEKDYKRIVKALPKPKEKPPSHIDVTPRAFTLREIEWWNKHLQSLDDLKRENIMAIGSAYLNGKELYRDKDELAFAYYFPEVDKWKLYYPERDVKSGKWISTISGGYVEGKENLIDGEKGVILGSRKDKLVFSKFYPYVCNTQNESNTSFDEEFVSYLKTTNKQTLLGYDTDLAGFRAMKLLIRQYDFGHITVPTTTGHKDWASWCYNEGVYPITNHLFKKKLII